MNHGKIASKLLFVLAVLTCLCWGCSGSDAAEPRARHGVIDLSVVDLLNSDPVRLDGEWEFYWKQLLTPDDFRGVNPPVASVYLAFPAAWNGVRLKGEKLGGAGYATFRLRILAGGKPRELALHLVDLNSAYRLWVNGKLLVENGVVGTDGSEETPNLSIRQPRLSLVDQPVELVLQLSNHQYREGGVISAIELGRADKLKAAQLRQWGLALLCIGSLMVTRES